ncbi:helix-turn-helix transcriptional regulator [Marivirga arenosa]|uniref:Helix-turn-helix transcriptional regulator n=1 Tax=Marivirga arenosa TaxID=3059076 RepID=A0AA51R9B7_9BACT|nr:helix-turn-helix transcriptional regulator [Marivirga sp. ABR2-2]WMN07476.1 helix-turn-helix transcriptional regulator [Marivirga sp. ABR2-2]
MKQPELGHKIQNWRKAKGLTQEELVERCNLNVRTLQRIEAGEVLPRSYTVKSILDVLEVDFSALNLPDTSEKDIYTLLKPNKKFIQWAAVLGVLYLCLSFVEGFIEIGYFYDFGIEVSGVTYSLIKLGIMLSFSVFYYVFYIIGKKLDDGLLKVSAIVLIGLIVISSINDISVFYTEYISIEFSLMMTSVVFGIGYTLLGIALLMRKELLGNLALVSGIFGIVSGVGFTTIIMAIPALFTLTIFEILLIVLIVRLVSSNSNELAESVTEVSAVNS